MVQEDLCEKNFKDAETTGKGAQRDKNNACRLGTKKRSELRLGGSVAGKVCKMPSSREGVYFNILSRATFYSTLDIGYL
jgi:hypothetical protein